MSPTIARPLRVALFSCTVSLALIGCHGCGNGATAPEPTPPDNRPVPGTVRPITVPPGETLTYLFRGAAGILDHPESRQQLPRPDRITLRHNDHGHIDCHIALGRAPAGQTPRVPVPTEVLAEWDPDGLVRLGHDDPTHSDQAHAHDGESAELGPRIYATIANILLLRPNAPKPADRDRWEDIAWFGPVPAAWPGRCFVEADGTRTIGGRTCERYLWRMEAGPPRHYLAGVQVVDASGLTYYDAAAERVVAAEAMLRFAEDATAWGFVPWTWLSVALEGVEYTASEVDATWVDAAYTLKPDEPPADRLQKIQENTAIKRLYGMHKGMVRFQGDAKVDVNGNGVGEFGFLSELAGVTNLRTPGGLLGAKIPYVRDATYTDYGVFRHHGICDARGRSLGEGYLWYCLLDGADGPIAQAERPPDGDVRHAALQERPRSWTIWAWPQDDADAQLVLHVDSEGVIRGTYDLPWRGDAGGPAAPALTRQTDGVTWTARSHTEHLPPPPMKLEILVDGVDVPTDTYSLLARHRGNLIKLRTPDMFATLPREVPTKIREQEWRWRDAWRDRRISVEEIGPIVEAVDALLSGRAPK